jgi:gamma-D-glutamyl-L-lysine dipeptidyl-peptidase
VNEALAVSVPVTTVWTAPDAPRPADALAVRSRPDPAGWADSMDTASRLDLHGRTLTQALLGEPAVPLEERDGWVRIVLPWQPSGLHQDGYPGWVPAAHLGTPGEPGDHSTVVATPTVECHTGDGTVTLSYGTILPVLDATDDWTTVSLPGGRSGRLPTRRVRPPGTDPDAADWTDSLLRDARRFVGLRYLWGGTAAWGLDCSGFVHLVHRAHGSRVPRDAVDQLPAAEPVELDTATPGDLYFFAFEGRRPHHVGYVTQPAASGDRVMLHAPEETELIEEAAMAGDRVATLVSAGRFRPGTGS